MVGFGIMSAECCNSATLVLADLRLAYNCQTYVGDKSPGVIFAAVREVTLHKLLVKLFFPRLYVILLQFTTQLNLICL